MRKPSTLAAALPGDEDHSGVRVRVVLHQLLSWIDNAHPAFLPPPYRTQLTTRLETIK